MESKNITAEVGERERETGSSRRRDPVAVKDSARVFDYAIHLRLQAVLPEPPC